MGSKQINPLFGIQEETRKMIIGNPYRFANVAWTPPNAVLWYYGDSVTDGKWTDRIGTNHATFAGGATADINGVACSTSKYAYITNTIFNSFFENRDIISFSFWTKVTNTSYGDRVIVGVHGGSWTANNIGIYLDTASSPDWVKFFLKRKYSITVKDISDGNWHHIAAVYDNVNDVSNIYIDSVKQTINPTTMQYISIMAISANFDFGYYADYIDDCIISNVAWSDANVTDIYNNSPATHK